MTKLNSKSGFFSISRHEREHVKSCKFASDDDIDDADEDDNSVGAPSVADSHPSDRTSSGDITVRNGTTGGGGGGANDDDGSSSHHQLGSKETSRVNRAKFVAYSVLVSTAVVVAFAVYFYMTTVEENAFETQFKNDSRKIVDSVGRGIVNSLAVLDNFAFVAVSLAKFFRKDKGIPAWPFVSIPDFGLRAAKDRASCSGIIFSFQPIIIGEKERLVWERFTANTTNQYWVNQTKRIQETDANFFGKSTYDTPERIQMWNDNGDIPYNTTRYVLVVHRFWIVHFVMYLQNNYT
jgi:hypothetical protein